MAAVRTATIHVTQDCQYDFYLYEYTVRVVPIKLWVFNIHQGIVSFASFSLMTDATNGSTCEQLRASVIWL